MPIVNADVAAVFNEIDDLLEVQGANVFRVRACRNAARMLSEPGRSVKTLVDQGEDLDSLPGIGPDLAGKITEIVATGSCAQLERLRKELPPAITELLKIPGLGLKRVRALHQELGIQTLELDHLRFGIGQARRSGLEADDVLNTCTQQALRPLLDASMSRKARSPEHAAGTQQAL